MAFQIIRNDITKITADAIVNTANPEPVCMAGTDSAIYAAAGADKLLEARRKIGMIEEGSVAVTPAFDLEAKYIFHTVGPVWQGGDKGEKEVVRNCYVNCLNKALELGVESIAFPLIATGVYGFPKADALQIATSVFSSFLSENEMSITLVVFDNESFALSGKIFAGIDQFIDDHYVEAKTDEEYGFGNAISDSEAVFEDAAEEPAEDARRRRKEERFRFLNSRMLAREEECRMAPPPEHAAPASPVAAAGAAMAAPASPKMQAKRSLDDVMKNLSETWSESLLRMITEKGYEDTEVYKRANVDRKLFSKIRSNKDYKPKKTTAVAFALALRLNLDETKDFIARAGYAFSPSSKFDLIIEYFIENEVYDFMTINIALFDHDEPLIG
ncbi:MAG: macro domain-containing protein [Saccharofermentans sp.]|nr:macro domain-containing protein [Saccharofermentans sp.]